MRFLLTPPGGSRPTLVVETRTEVDRAAIDELRADLHGMGCPNGIIFDEEHCVILRDTFATMDASSIVEAGHFSTEEVLGRVVGGRRPLDRRVEQWLDILSTNWDQALPIEPRLAAPFIPDIVSAASGSMVHAVGGG